MMLPARQLSTLLESLEISCRQKNSQSAFSVVACVLLHACSFMSRARLRVGMIFLLDAVSEKHSILARSVFVLHGHRFCRDIAVVLVASIAIWILDIYLFSRETGNWRFTGSEIRCIPYHPLPSLPSPPPPRRKQEEDPRCGQETRSMEE